MTERTCVIDGCDRQLRARGWCSTHWKRWRKYGHPEALAPTPEIRLCSLDECDAKHYGHGLCVKHLARWKKHGDVARVDTGGYAHPKGPSNPKWQGDNIGYAGAHDRVRSLRGAPAVCARCGDTDRVQWALNWDAATSVKYEETHRRGKLEWLPYSPNVDDYMGLCPPCHRAFDLANARTQT